MLFNFPNGFNTGFDVSTVYQSLMSKHRVPITQLQSDNSKISTQKDDFGEIKDSLSNLALTSRSLMDYLSSAKADKITSSDEDVVTAAITGTATIGTHDVTVTSIATKHKVASDWGTLNNAYNQLQQNDVIGITVNGQARNITLTTGLKTMAALAADINTQAGDIVTATMEYSGGNERLIIESDTTGLAGQMTITDDGATLQSGASIGILSGGNIDNVITAAANAAYNINGTGYTSSSNIVDNVIPGVTLTLTGAGSAKVNLSPKSADLETEVKKFTDAYNEVISLVHDKAEDYPGDHVLRNIETKLQNIVSSEVKGSGLGTFDALAQIGITTNTDGTLSIASAKLASANEYDFESVMDIFRFDRSDNTRGVAQQMVDVVNGRVSGGTFQPGMIHTTGGIVTNRETSLSTMERRNNTRIDELESNSSATSKSLVTQLSASIQNINTYDTQKSFLDTMYGLISSNSSGMSALNEDGSKAGS